MNEFNLNIVNGIYLCDACLDGVGGECHTPGCALWISRAPDIPIREQILCCGGEIKMVEPTVTTLADKYRIALYTIAKSGNEPLTNEDAKDMVKIARMVLGIKNKG